MIKNPLKWVKTIHKLLNGGFEKCKHHFRKRSPHRSLIAAPQTARATFMFTVESFNARGHFDELCQMCNCGKDCAEHIPECTNTECRNIIEETRQIIQNKFKPEDMNVKTIEHTEWWHHVEIDHSNHMKQICVTNYGDLFRRCTS